MAFDRTFDFAERTGFYNYYVPARSYRFDPLGDIFSMLRHIGRLSFSLFTVCQRVFTSEAVHKPTLL